MPPDITDYRLNRFGIQALVSGNRIFLAEKGDLPGSVGGVREILDVAGFKARFGDQFSRLKPVDQDAINNFNFNRGKTNLQSMADFDANITALQGQYNNWTATQKEEDRVRRFNQVIQDPTLGTQRTIDIAGKQVKVVEFPPDVVGETPGVILQEPLGSIRSGEFVTMPSLQQEATRLQAVATGQQQELAPGVSVPTGSPAEQLATAPPVQPQTLGVGGVEQAQPQPLSEFEQFFNKRISEGATAEQAKQEYAQMQQGVAAQPQTLGVGGTQPQSSLEQMQQAIQQVAQTIQQLQQRVNTEGITGTGGEVIAPPQVSPQAPSTQIPRILTSQVTTPESVSTASTPYAGPSIVDYLKSVGQASDFASRTKLAQQYGIQNYTGTAEENTQLLGILRGQIQPQPQTPAVGQPRVLQGPSETKPGPGPWRIGTISPERQWVFTPQGWQPTSGAEGFGPITEEQPTITEIPGRVPGEEGFTITRPGETTTTEPPGPETAPGFQPPVQPPPQQPTQQPSQQPPPQQVQPTSFEQIQGELNRIRSQIAEVAQGVTTLNQAPPPSIPDVSPTIQEIVVQMPPEMQELFGALKTSLDELKRRGQMVNPNVEITPEKLAEFTRIAEEEIDPFYRTQLSQAREGFLRSMGFTRDEILRQEQNLERQYGRQLQGIGEEAAETGFALSGRRQFAERELGETTQRGIENLRRRATFEAGTAGREFAGQFGGLLGERALPSVSMPRAPRVSAGERTFAPGIGEDPFYELSPSLYSDIIGEQEFARRGAKQRRIGEQEKAFREFELTRQLATLNL